jgi:hypothetical protein
MDHCRTRGRVLFASADIDEIVALLLRGLSTRGPVRP